MPSVMGRRNSHDGLQKDITRRTLLDPKTPAHLLCQGHPRHLQYYNSPFRRQGPCSLHKMRLLMSVVVKTYKEYVADSPLSKSFKTSVESPSAPRQVNAVIIILRFISVTGVTGSNL